QAHLFGQGQTCARYVQQRIFLIRVARDAILAAAGRIDELDLNAGAHAGKIAIEPTLERIGRSRAAAFVRLSVVSAPRRMRFDFVGLAPHDVDAAAIGFPTRNAGSIVLVGVGDTLVVFLAILVFVGVRIGIAPAPKFFNEALALVVGFQLLKSFPLFVGDDVSDVFFEPILVSLFQFGLNVAGLLSWVLLIVVLLLREARRHGKTQSQESDGQTAQSAYGHIEITPSKTSEKLSRRPHQLSQAAFGDTETNNEF